MTKSARFWKVAGAAGVAALLAAGLVQAQPAPSPTQAPPQEAAPPSEEPPPAPGETGAAAIVPPAEAAPPIAIAPPPVKKDDEAKAETGAVKPAAASVDTGPPGVRKRHGAVVIQALDKITAETMRFEAKVGVPIRWKGLVFTVRACETTASDEPMQDVAAYLDVRAEPRTQTEEKPSRQVFRGWMFASAPGVSALQHPVYDAWVITCRA